MFLESDWCSRVLLGVRKRIVFWVDEVNYTV